MAFRRAVLRERERTCLGCDRQMMSLECRQRFLVLLATVVSLMVYVIADRMDLDVVVQTKSETNVATIKNKTETDIPPQKKLDHVPELGDHVPKGLRVVMMGDSIMRYQYLSLAYFLRHGKWFDPSIRTHHLTNSKTFDSWNSFLRQTNAHLLPNEFCDCYRDDDAIGQENIVENRYFFDETRNNSLVFITAYGIYYKLHGRVLPQDVPQKRSSAELVLSSPLKGNSTVNSTTFLWESRDWDWVVRNHVANLEPKPTHFVFNAGLWPNSLLYDDVGRSNLIAAIKDSNLTAVWRRTTYNRKHECPEPFCLEQDPFCSGNLDIDVQCVDSTWTQNIRDDMYFDFLHAYEPFYRIMNEDLLEALGHTFTSDYHRVNRRDYSIDTSNLEVSNAGTSNSTQTTGVGLQDTVEGVETPDRTTATVTATDSNKDDKFTSDPSNSRKETEGATTTKPVTSTGHMRTKGIDESPTNRTSEHEGEHSGKNERSARPKNEKAKETNRTFSGLVAGKAPQSLANRNVPNGLRLVLMGDSVMRYQYLSLVFYLRHGVWFDPSNRTHHLTHEKSFSSWTDFFNFTNSLLAPHEYCDCFRDEELSAQHITENRYFHDAKHNNSVVYIAAYGTLHKVHGHLSPQGLQSKLRNPKFLNTTTVNTTYRWETLDWPWVVRNHVAKLKPKPTHIVFNAGLWPSHLMWESRFRQDLVQSSLNNSMMPIWRNTTYHRDHSLRREELMYDEYFCSQDESMVCLDTTWTASIRSEFYWDYSHFFEPIYRCINEDLLEQIGHLFPSDYSRLDYRDFTEDVPSTG